jgi:hypothetical protein
LSLIWQGTVNDEFSESSIIGTAAIALKLLGKCTSQEDAHQLASHYWLNRNKKKFTSH